MASNPPITSSEPDTIPPTAPSNKKAMFVVFLVVLVDLLGFSIVLPLLPITGKEYLEPLFPGERGELWVGVTTGLLMASFSAMQFLVAPSWGRLSDRIGRRVVLLVGLFASVLFYGLFGYAAGLPVETHATIA